MKMTCLLLRHMNRLGICRNARPITLLKYGEHIISCEAQSIVPKRHMTEKNSFSPFSNRHKQDKIPKDYTLIYSNLSSNRTRLAIIVLQCTVVITGFVLLNYFPDNLNLTKDIGSIFLKINTFLLYLTTFVFATLVYKRTMLRIYKNRNTNTYVGIFPRCIVFSQKLDFTAEQITQNTSKTAIKRLLHGDVQIKGRRFLFSSNHFIQPKFYNEILKYDK